MRRAALRRPETLTDKYRLLGKIGEGTYGMVFKAEASASAVHPRAAAAAVPSAGAASQSAASSSLSAAAVPLSSATDAPDERLTFAIKLVKSHKEGKNDVVLSSATVREIKLLRELHHDNVVHLHDVHVDTRDKSLALVFEYGDHDLHDIIVQSKQKPLGEYTRKSLMFQILKGVDYMHDAWVMHRDMKPQNILVVGHGRKRGQVKLADLGLARIYKEPIKALSDVERVVVTLWYRAPELLLGAKHYTKAVDLWAVGCIFVELINTRELFCGKEVEGSNAPFQKDQLDKIFKVLGMPTPQAWEGLENLPEYHHVVQMGRERKYPTQSELKNAVKVGPGRAGAALLDLLSRLLEYDPETRITAKEALEHEYFTDIEPEPRDWAFDEPGKEPISFRTQTVEPVSDDIFPWKNKKEGTVGAEARQSESGACSPHRDGPGSHSSQHHNDHRGRDAHSRSRSHHGSRDGQQHSQRRNDRNHAGDAGTRNRGAFAGGNAPGRGGSGWRDRGSGRSGGAAATNAGAMAGVKRSGGGEPGGGGSNSGRLRSPKQQRRR